MKRVRRVRSPKEDISIPDRLDCRCSFIQPVIDKILAKVREIDKVDKERNPNGFESQDLYFLRGVVYVIENWKNGRYYVGQTIKTFAIRYGGSGLWYQNTHNRLLLQDVDRYGPGAFRARIVGHSDDPKELDRLELLYADKFNAYSPHGYNYKMCGTNDAENLSRMCNLATVPPGKISDPNGVVYDVEDWATFCNQRGVDKYSIWKVVTGRAEFHHGWTLPNVEKKNHINEKKYTLYDKNGNRYDFAGLSEFCRINGLKKAGIQTLVLGRNIVSQGFARHPDDFNKTLKRYHLILEKDGREVLITSAKKQAKSLGTHPRYIYELARGDIESHHGWRLKSKEIVPVRNLLLDKPIQTCHYIP